MNTNDPTDPTRETATVDGSDQTEQEATLSAQGLEEGSDEPAPAAAAAEPAAAAPEPAPAAAAPEPAAPAAAAVVEPEPAPAAAAAPAIAEVGPKPEPPKDFDAEFSSLQEKLDSGDLTSEEYNAAFRTLSREEGRYESQLTFWEQQDAARQRQVQDAAARFETDWNTAAASWEADPSHKEFLSNPLRAKMMQESVEVVDRQARADGKVLAPTQLLDEALRVTREALGMTAPPPPPQNGQHQVRTAVGDRRPPAAPATLGDLPSAGSDPIRGNEAYETLDALPIEDLEEQVQRMTGDSVERFLRAAPGANATGHAAAS